MTTALRNLSLDQRNRELIGKYAMKDLVNKLPPPQQKERDRHVSDQTIGAVLGVLFETVRSSSDFTRNLHECGGTDRLRFLARAYPQYGTRVCKYASQVCTFQFFVWSVVIRIHTFGGEWPTCIERTRNFFVYRFCET